MLARETEAPDGSRAGHLVELNVILVLRQPVQDVRQMLRHQVRVIAVHWLQPCVMDGCGKHSAMYRVVAWVPGWLQVGTSAS